MCSTKKSSGWPKCRDQKWNQWFRDEGKTAKYSEAQESAKPSQTTELCEPAKPEVEPVVELMPRSIMKAESQAEAEGIGDINLDITDDDIEGVLNVLGSISTT